MISIISTMRPFLSGFRGGSSKADQPETIELQSGQRSTVRTANASLAVSAIPQATIDALAGINVSEQKSDLVGKVGDELGIRTSDFAKWDDYQNAIAAKLEELGQTSDGQNVLDDLEGKLGLSKLGVSLQIIQGAMTTPGGEDDQKLNAAFRSGSDIEREYQEAMQRYQGSHDDGTYSPKVAKTR
ncbi:hypothetical protein [Rhizobium sp. Rhizsp42]|uniref:hypothetical protein n=1 Tax=Rhizobium sp. Rhizsp42 TaxID=3243034 RepID=UPI0039B00F0D